MTDTIDGSVTFHGNAVPRLFVAVGLPDSFKAAVRQLQSGLPNARWVQADSLHLTLAFIGDVNEGTQRGIEAGLNSVSAPALDLNISGLGRFPTAAQGSLVRRRYLIHGAPFLLSTEPEGSSGGVGRPVRRKFQPEPWFVASPVPPSSAAAVCDGTEVADCDGPAADGSWRTASPPRLATSFMRR